MSEVGKVPIWAIHKHEPLVITNHEYPLFIITNHELIVKYSVPVKLTTGIASLSVTIAQFE